MTTATAMLELLRTSYPATDEEQEQSLGGDRFAVACSGGDESGSETVESAPVAEVVEAASPLLRLTMRAQVAQAERRGYRDAATRYGD